MQTTTQTTTSPFKKVWSLFKPSESTLLSPVADALMAGGLSILLYVAMAWFIPKSASTLVWSWTVYYLAFLINYPHFMASYQLIYHDSGPYFLKLRSNTKYALRLWWAGLFVPVILLGYFFYALSQDSNVLMGYMVNAMFFFVGWHYVKQIFGTIIVLSVAKKIFYTKLERWAMLIPLYTLWMMSYSNSNLYGGTSNYYGVPYSSFNLPDTSVKILYVLLIFATIFMAILMIRKYQKSRVIMPLAAILAMVSIYLWFLPIFSHPYYLLVIPFLHSLQYLLFVGAYKRNQAVADTVHATDNAQLQDTYTNKLTIVSTITFIALPVIVAIVAVSKKFITSFENMLRSWYGLLPTLSNTVLDLTLIVIVLALAIIYWLRRLGRTSAVSKIVLFVLEMIVLGALLFSIIPTIFDIMAHNEILPAQFIYNTTTFGSTLYLFLFIIFVNIHHYFIDNVIWKRDNPNLKENLYYHHMH